MDMPMPSDSALAKVLNNIKPEIRNLNGYTAPPQGKVVAKLNQNENPYDIPLEWKLHVDSRLQEKGLAMIYNPLSTPVTRTLTLPLYYTGLTRPARVREQDGPPHEYPLNEKREVKVKLSVPARGLTWLTIE